MNKLDDKLFNILLKQKCPSCYEEPLKHNPRDLLDHYGADFFMAFMDWFVKQPIRKGVNE